MNAEIIVAREHDASGTFVVAEKNGRRSLRTENGTLQSMIFADRPAFPAMDYCRAMTAVLLFRRHPARVLLVGLGGGTFANFLLHRCPKTRIEAVEISPAVIDLAHRYFLVPRDDPRLLIHQGDGFDFVAGKARLGECYDQVIVDAFDEDGTAVRLRGREFYGHCRRLAGDTGIVAVNLWDRPKDGFQEVFETLRSVFNDAVLMLRLGENYCNVVVFAFGNPAHMRNLNRLRPAARSLGVHSALSRRDFSELISA